MGLAVVSPAPHCQNALDDGRRLGWATGHQRGSAAKPSRARTTTMWQVERLVHRWLRLYSPCAVGFSHLGFLVVAPHVSKSPRKKSACTSVREVDLEGTYLKVETGALQFIITLTLREGTTMVFRVPTEKTDDFGKFLEELFKHYRLKRCLGDHGSGLLVRRLDSGKGQRCVEARRVATQ